MTGTVYGIFDRGGNCVYVGQTRTSITRRMSRHRADTRRKNTVFLRWLRRHPRAEIRTLLDGIPIAALTEWECTFMARLSVAGHRLLNAEVR